LGACSRSRRGDGDRRGLGEPLATRALRASSRTLSHWYARLAAALESGFGLVAHLEDASGPAAQGRAALAASLRGGASLEEALEREGLWLPQVDRCLMIAGSRAGRLPEVCRRLAERHGTRVRTQRALAFTAAYPLAVLHFGAVALPLVNLVNGNGWGVYLSAVSIVLGPVWMLGGLIAWGMAARSRAVKSLLDAVPFVGGYRKAQALADLAFVLEAHLSAGTRVDAAWALAGAASGDQRLRRVARVVGSAIERGEPVAPTLALGSEVPMLFAEYYRNGELTGRLDEALRNAQRHFSESASARLRLAGMVYPALLFLGVAIWVAARVVVFYSDYFGQIERMSQ